MSISVVSIPCRGTNLCDVVMGNKQEPSKSLRFHHGALHYVNVQSEVRKVLAFALYLVLNHVRWLQKRKDSLSRSVSLLIGILKCWQLCTYVFNRLKRSPPALYLSHIISCVCKAHVIGPTRNLIERRELI